MTGFRGIAAGIGVAALAGGLWACSSLGLGQVVQAPRISAAGTQQAQMQLVGPTLNNPYGGARIRLFARIENPNPFGLTLASLGGRLFLQQQEAALVDLPMGLPLLGQQDTIVPIDLTIGFDDLPNLADVVRRAVGGGSLDYRLDGSVGVDAGALGTPSFGPMTLMEGKVRVFD